jgi:hypothetical protein
MGAMSTPYRASTSVPARLPASFHSELANELEPGENLVWTGFPIRERLRLRALASLAFPLLWNGLVVLLIYASASASASTSGHGGGVWLCAVPFLAMGFPLFSAPLDAWSAVTTTFYAVTDRRVIVFDGEDVLSYRRASLRAVDCAERRDGSGDLTLVLADRASSGRRAGLYAVPRVREVAALLIPCGS